MKNIFEHITEPEYVYRWKAVWEDDDGVQHVNICWRVQQNSALGPYKGGLRFDPSKSGLLMPLLIDDVAVAANYVFNRCNFGYASFPGS